MRYIGLLLTLAIIYILFTRMSYMNHAEKAEVTQVFNAADPTPTPAPGATPSSSPAQTDSLKAPLDRTRQVLDQVRKQKSEDQF